MADLFAIAKLTGCFGIKGYIKAQALTHTPRRLLKLKNVFIGVGPDKLQEMNIEDVVFQQRSVLIKLQGVDDRTAAERFVGQYVFIDAPDVVKPPEGSYFVHDLLGCEVRTQDGKVYGVIEDVLKTASQDIWTIRQGDTVRMLPAVNDFIIRVEIPNRLVIVKLIEGLLE
ncbi:MAG: ribosome maturation factor RimM [Bacteroidota bacterium]